MDATTRDLLISLSSHMAYMQGQLEADHQYHDPDDYYWYRESVALRQRVADLLASSTDGPAVPEGREPAAVVGEPSDEEIMELMPPQMHEDFAFAARAMANEAGTDSQKAKGFMRIALNLHAVDLALAVLARFGNHFPDAKKMVRPAPVPPGERQSAPVSERLPQPEDCDAEGRCWWGRPESDEWSADWTLATPEAIAEFCEFSPPVTWLPFNALPLPQGEGWNDR